MRRKTPGVCNGKSLVSKLIAVALLSTLTLKIFLFLLAGKVYSFFLFFSPPIISSSIDSRTHDNSVTGFNLLVRASVVATPVSRPPAKRRVGVSVVGGGAWRGSESESVTSQCRGPQPTARHAQNEPRPTSNPPRCGSLSPQPSNQTLADTRLSHSPSGGPASAKGGRSSSSSCLSRDNHSHPQIYGPHIKSVISYSKEKVNESNIFLLIGTLMK